ncbi:hypothetical protein F0726_02499 [Acidithiobacillus caldus]|nr:hypothetical protein F0726_02499 [Acidithiobacillus caldus]
METAATVRSLAWYGEVYIHIHHYIQYIASVLAFLVASVYILTKMAQRID